MFSRRTKALFYELMGLPMRLNGVFYRAFRAPRKGVVKAYLGPYIAPGLLWQERKVNIRRLRARSRAPLGLVI